MIAISAATTFAFLALVSLAGLVSTFYTEQRKSRRGDVGMQRFNRHITALNTEHRRESISRMRDETKPHGERRFGS
jgi:choline-glycine betaine transporter